MNVRTAVILPDGSRALELGSGTITDLIGLGGMANIYKVFNTKLEVHRAVKLMHPNLSEDSRRHFETEMKIMAGLSHPNIVEIHSVGLWNTLPYIEMEFLEGFTLGTLVKERGALPVVVCTSIALLVARALNYAHNKEYRLFGKKYKGIIHRDLKPSNIMVTSDGVVKLMDFGIARPIEVSLFTTDGAIMGTMQYLAPEQLDGKSAEITADIYSFGTVLYEMLSGNKAFPQVSLSRLMSCKVKNEYRPLSEYTIKIPRQLCKLVHQCMVHDKRKRVANVELLLHQLERIHHSLTLDTPEQVLRQYMKILPGQRTVLRVRRHSSLPIFAVALGAALVAGFGTKYVISQIKPETLGFPPQTVEPITVDNSASRALPDDPSAPPPDNQSLSRNSDLDQPPESQSPEPGIGSSSSKSLPPQADESSSDPGESFVQEVESGKLIGAYERWPSLPERVQDDKKVAIYYLRTLAALDKREERANFVATRTIPDGEFLLQKAKVRLESGDPGPALDLLEQAVAMPAEFLPSSQQRIEYLYTRAAARTKAFDLSNSETDLSAAMDAWFEVRNFLRNNREHPYHQKAIDAMQQLARARG